MAPGRKLKNQDTFFFNIQCLRKHSVLSFFYLRSKILTFSPLDGHTPLPMHKKMWWPYLGFFSSTFDVWESKVSYFFYSLRRCQDMCIFSPLRWDILQFMILAQLNPILFLFSFFFFFFSPYAFLIQRLFEWKCG